MGNRKAVKGEKEEGRISALLSMIPDRASSVLDIGAREGYISLKLTDFFDSVTALDLEKPDIKDNRITCLKGDVTDLQFPDNSFHTVLCSEVLEHIPHLMLNRACDEIQRVAQQNILIGVPYRQDIRVGRTTCLTCEKKNPPWGHVNSFDKKDLLSLFSEVSCQRVCFHGEGKEQTNCLSTLLMDIAGNPYGDYSQQESCIYCGSQLKEPPERNMLKKVCTKLAIYIKRLQSSFVSPRPIWINILFKKGTG